MAINLSNDNVSDIANRVALNLLCAGILVILVFVLYTNIKNEKNKENRMLEQAQALRGY